MFELFKQENMNPIVTPKFIDEDKCINCGHCAIRCPTNAKWDTRALVNEALEKGARLIKNTKVIKLKIKNNHVHSIITKHRFKKKEYFADLVVVCAGGLNTPVTLKNSGIEVKDRLFVDLVLCVAGYKVGTRQDQQLLMPFISQ